MVGEVISDEGVEQVLVAIEVRGGDRDELAVPGRCGAPRRPSQEVGFIGEQRRGHQQRRRIAGPVARSRISAGASGSPPITRQIRFSTSSGMRELSR